MDYVVVEGVKPWDGRYELDLDGAPITIREWGWLKRFANYLPADLDRRTFTDPEVIGVLAIIAMHRADKIPAADAPDLWERLQDVPFGSTITMELGDLEEADEVEDPTAGSNGNATFSGASSPTGSDPWNAPESYWAPSVGYFGIRPGDVGELTPVQMLDCALLFEQLAAARAAI